MNCRTKKFMLALAVLLASSTLASAQANPVTSAVKEILPRQQKNLVGAAEEMPADKFGYKPTAPQMSFGHLIVHIAESNNSLCAAIGNLSAPASANLKETDSKEKLLAALRESFEFCNGVLAKVDDSKLNDPVELWGGRKGTVAFALIALTNDWADHYSAAAMYLRLNGMLPPSAQKKK
ncbi:MAG TPA: DinB family protein [Terriglobales bacterium]|nr:DinB family protein [Terriglobales bacterium]